MRQLVDEVLRDNGDSRARDDQPNPLPTGEASGLRVEKNMVQIGDEDLALLGHPVGRQP